MQTGVAREECAAPVRFMGTTLQVKEMTGMKYRVLLCALLALMLVLSTMVAPVGAAETPAAS